MSPPMLNTWLHTGLKVWSLWFKVHGLACPWEFGVSGGEQLGSDKQQQQHYKKSRWWNTSHNHLCKRALDATDINLATMLLVVTTAVHAASPDAFYPSGAPPNHSIYPTPNPLLKNLKSHTPNFNAL